MNKDPKASAPNPPKNTKIVVANPRYEGANPVMIAKALFRRVKKASQTDDVASDDAQSST